jgi:hypothetical protein
MQMTRFAGWLGPFSTTSIARCGVEGLGPLAAVPPSAEHGHQALDRPLQAGGDLLAPRPALRLVLRGRIRDVFRPADQLSPGEDREPIRLGQGSPRCPPPSIGNLCERDGVY